MSRLFRLFHVAPPGPEPLAEEFLRALAAVGRPGQGCSRLLFHLEDSPVGGASAVDRIVRAVPDAERFRYQRPARPYLPGPAFSVLSNFPPPWSEPNPNHPEGSLSPEAIETILGDIPRRFPVFQAGVVFDGVDWPGTGEGLAAGPARGERDPTTPYDWGYLFPNVSLRLLAKDQACHATVECADPAAELDPVTATKLKRLGPIRSEDVRAGFTPAELAVHRRRRAEAEAVLGEVKAEWAAWLADRVGLPHAWPPAREAPVETRFSLKEPLLRHFRPLGYRAAPAPRGASTMSLWKPMPRHHLLQLYADRGTWSRSLVGQFRFVGLETTHTLDLPSDARGTVQYLPRHQDDVDRVVANWAAVVQALERDLVPRLEAVYGDGPGWLPAIVLGSRLAKSHSI